MDSAMELITRHGGHGGEGSGPAKECETGNEFDGRMDLRIASVFVILIGSSIGALLPVWARQDPKSTDKKKGRRKGAPPWVFFITKFFGSGVIIATAFIHLLAPAHEALGNPCLTGSITEYPWVEGIMLMTIILLFFVELMVMRYARFGLDHDHDDHAPNNNRSRDSAKLESGNSTPPAPSPPDPSQDDGNAPPGHNHFGHTHNHPTDEGVSAVTGSHTAHLEDYAAQLTSIFILEFGIIFHSIFIGLTLAVAGEEFVTLFIVLTFHQTFEGLGLGSRLATVPWPRSKRSTPYILALAFGVSTPIAIAIGLGVRNSYPPQGRTTLIVNGVFDSISAGILMYASLVELMAHEFMFSSSMRRASIRTVLSAFGLLCLGALLMALLGKWA